MKLSYFSILFILVLMLPSQLIFSQEFEREGWEIAVNKNDVKIYAKEVAGSPMDELKSEVIIATSVDKVLSLIRDIDNYSDWIYKSSESKILKKVSENEYYYYAVADLPWPATDRDTVNRLLVKEKEDGSVICTVNAIPDYIPPKSCCERLPFAQTLWVLTPLDGEKTLVEWFNRTDPGGSIPDWMLNIASTDSPYYTITKFREILEK